MRISLRAASPSVSLSHTCEDVIVLVNNRCSTPAGLIWFIPWLDVIQTVDLRTVSFNIQPQEVRSSSVMSE